MIAPSRVAALFALFGTLAVLLLATIMPPYQNADENAHYMRADQLAHGGLVSRGGPGAAALIDSGVVEGGQVRFYELSRTRSQHATRDLYVPIPWGGRVADCAPNTALYPPLLYGPAALGIGLGQRLGFTVLPTMEVARAASGFASVAVGTVAIALAGPAAIWLFAVLTLPMALALSAALSQDGPMIACAALAASLSLRLQDPAARRPVACYGVMCAAVALIATARPPYTPLAVLTVLPGRLPRALRWSGAAAVLGCVVGWCWVSATETQVSLRHFGPATDAAAQARLIVGAPWRVASIAYSTIGSSGFDMARGFIGWLGWADVDLPVTYMRVAWGVLLVAAFCARRGSAGVIAGRTRLWVAGALAAALAAVFGIQYLTWTPVGSPVVEGVQGRYFLPLALIAAMLFARPLASGSRFAAALSWPVLLFPLASIVVMLHRVLLRYYL